MANTFPSREHAAELLKLQGFDCVSTNGREWRHPQTGIEARVIRMPDGSWDISYFN